MIYSLFLVHTCNTGAQKVKESAARAILFNIEILSARAAQKNESCVMDTFYTMLPLNPLSYLLIADWNL
jgi:hypothetical protein